MCSDTNLFFNATFQHHKRLVLQGLLPMKPHYYRHFDTNIIMWGKKTCLEKDYFCSLSGNSIIIYGHWIHHMCIWLLDLTCWALLRLSIFIFASAITLGYHMWTINHFLCHISMLYVYLWFLYVMQLGHLYMIHTRLATN